MKLIECPRDAMQGIKDFIPTATKINYLNALLRVGFDTIDAGSFVSPKAIPQMRDTAEVLKGLNLTSSKSKILVIVANERGAEEAVCYDEVTYLGFPFSISETFQQRNINSTISESLKRLEAVQNICIQKNKKLVTYFSMAFGNPYGDEWSPHIVAHWAERLLNDFGVKILALSDTIGSSTPESIGWLFDKLIPQFPEVEFGAHLHTTPDQWQGKIEAALKAGCTRIDGAIFGFGGCPMAKDTLTGNMPTEKVVNHLRNRHKYEEINIDAFNFALQEATKIFNIT